VVGSSKIQRAGEHLFLIFSEYLHFILGRIFDHTRDVARNILERIAIVNLM
jgi:hypothetical protein